MVSPNVKKVIWGFKLLSNGVQSFVEIVSKAWISGCHSEAEKYKEMYTYNILTHFDSGTTWQIKHLLVNAVILGRKQQRNAEGSS